MATIEIKDGKLIVHIHGIDKLLALRSTLTVPVEHIQTVTVRPADARGEGNVKAYRVAGALVGNTIAGYFWASEGLGSVQPVLSKLEQLRMALGAWSNDEGGYRRRALELIDQAEAAVAEGVRAAGQSVDDPGRGWAFFDVHDPDKAIGLDLAHERIRRVVVEIDNETPEAAAERIRAAMAQKPGAAQPSS